MPIPDRVRLYSGRNALRFIAAIFVAAMFQSTFLTFPQGDQPAILSRSSSRLSVVHLPNISYAEPEVRDQIVAAQKSLADSVGNGRSSDAELAEAYGTMGEIYQVYSFDSSANDCYLNATKLVPGDFRWVYLSAKLNDRGGNADLAISGYRNAIRIRPDYVAALVNLGIVYLQLNRLDEAGVVLDQALKLDERNAAALESVGQLALSKRDYASAVSRLEGALKLVPDANRLHYTLAMAYRGLGNTERARSELAQSGPVGVRVSDPLFDGLQDLVRGARLHIARGKTALDAHRYSDAADEFRNATIQQPDNPSAHYNLGAALSQTGDSQGAIEQFKETVRLDPSNAGAHYNLGVLFAQLNRSDDAIVELQAAIRIDPHDNSARFLLAREYAAGHRLEGTITELSAIVESDTDDEEALLALVRFLEGDGQFDRALSLLRKSNALYPNKGLTAVTLAHLLATAPRLELRDGKRALELSEAAYKATGSIDYGSLVAMALAELDRCSEAADFARRLESQAEREGKADLAQKLKTELARYETSRPCRPPPVNPKTSIP